MAESSGWTRGSRTALVFAASVIIISGMRAAAPILVPFLLAIFIAIITTPIFIGLQRIGVRGWIALLVMITGLVVFSIITFNILGSALFDFSRELPAYQLQIQARIYDIEYWLESKSVHVPEDLITTAVDSQSVIRFTRQIVNSTLGLMSQTFIILIVVIFMFFEAAAMPSKVRALPGLTEDDYARLSQMVDDVRRYMGLKTMMSLLTGTLVWALLLALRVDNALLFGVLAFILNYIPNIGSIIAAVPAVVLAGIQHGTSAGVITAIGFLVINVGVSNGIEPRYMGRGLGLSPLVIILTLIFWGWVLGPIGMLLSIPLTMAIRVALDSGDDTRWIAILMGGSVKDAPQLDGNSS